MLPPVVVPPPVRREFRAAWVATVDNIDWPSARGVSPAQQRAELIGIFERARELKFNVVILQVRPSADALYPSSIEPWSEYLTGRQGTPPSPAYDPLAFAVEEAHKRGLLLHCWLNPYRANHPSQKGPLAANHLGVTRPELVKKYGKFLWMDPGEPDVQARTLAVTRDIIRRYDIDGIHIDDYFYPYKEANLDFPDGPSFAKYQAQGGTLARADWRRKNVDDFVLRLYRLIKAERNTVQFGISPFGIYRPGVPAGIRAGVDQYADLYADAKKWLNEGWCDYFAPQLYWPIAQKPQSYPVLLKYWLDENRRNRHLIPGNFTSRTNPAEGNWRASEVVNQIKLTRQAGADGNIHFSMKSLMRNFNGITDALRGGVYSEPVLLPSSPWLDRTAPGKPRLAKSGSEFRWSPGTGDTPMWWVVWRRYGTRWLTQVLPYEQQRETIAAQAQPGETLNYVGVAAVDRTGNQSPVASWPR